MDPVLSNAVRKIIIEAYLKPKPRGEGTVNELAAERIAITLFQEAWKDLEKYKVETANNGSKPTQIGL